MKTSLIPRFIVSWGALLTLPLLVAVVSPAFGASLATWNGSVNRQWDTTTQNWVDSGGGSTVFDPPNDTALFTNIGAGTVNVQSSGISLSHTFTVDSTVDYVFRGGSLSGTGGITKMGNGRLTLENVNTYSGETRIGDAGNSGGILTLANPLAAQNSTIRAFGSTVEVKQSGTKVNSLALSNVGGVGSTLRINVDSSNTSAPALTAGAFQYDYGSGVAVSVSGFSGAPMTYWVLSGSGAGAIAPENVAVNVDASARVRREVISNANSLYVALTQSTFGALYGDLLTQNGWRVTQTIDYAISKGYWSALFYALDRLPASESVVSALNQLHAEAYVTQISFAAQLQRDFNVRLMNWRNMVANNGYYGYTDYYDTIGYRGNGFRKQRRYDLWATASAESMTRQRINDYSGYEGDSCGAAVGVEWKYSPCCYGGVAFGYDDARLEYRHINADDSLRAARVSLYGGYVNSCWYASGYLGYSKDWHHTTRRIRIADHLGTDGTIVPGFSADAQGRYDDSVASAGFELGKFYSCYDLNIIPTIGMNYVYVHSPRIREENGTSANLLVNSMSYNSLQMPVGIRTNIDLCICSGLILTPELRLFGVTEWADHNVRRTAYFREVPQAGVFYNEGGGWGRNGFLFGLGLTAQSCCRITIGLNYDCESWKDYNRHIGSAFLNYRW